MTAEVGILNRIGVALAADSAVSIGREANKIWTSADKLFHLSQSAPVGIMVFGNANFVGIPWETVVKEFRKELADSRFDQLEQYANRFFRFLGRSRVLFPEESQDKMAEELIVDLLYHLRHDVESRLTREAEQRDGLDDDEIGPIVDDVVSDRLSLIRKQARLKGFGKKTVAEIRRRYGPAVRRVRSDVFGKLPITSGVSRKIASVALEMLVRHYLGPSQSGVVVAGFGETEGMPALYCYEVEEMVSNRPRVALTHEHRIAMDNRAVIIPFAQQEIVHAFLQSIDEKLAAHMRKSTADLFTGAISAILDAIGDLDPVLKENLSSAVEPEVQGVLQKLFKDWHQQSVRHWWPIVEIVSSLPKDELAGMAEALVNLTKFRRRITPERETVGGPIDVAVITKGDGFVWIKRKHYFDPALNPRTLARYTGEA
ncbi:MAG: hypothetical protein GY719_14630 [bacterium]|nr:hypothetical protein [bacterium]